MESERDRRGPSSLRNVDYASTVTELDVRIAFAELRFAMTDS
jgi:hypothetical protein